MMKWIAMYRLYSGVMGIIGLVLIGKALFWMHPKVLAFALVSILGVLGIGGLIYLGEYLKERADEERAKAERDWAEERHRESSEEEEFEDIKFMLLDDKETISPVRHIGSKMLFSNNCNDIIELQDFLDTLTEEEIESLRND